MKYGYNLFSAWQVVTDRESLIAYMKELKKLGYDGVEFFEYFGITGEEMKQITDSIGIAPFSTHPRLVRFFEHLDEEIAYAKAAGIETLVMPHIPDEDCNDAYYQKLIAAIPKWKEKCDAAGLKLAWHNHGFEFAPYGGGILLDAILAADTGVNYEIDVFWTTDSGADTQALMDRYRDRIKYVHFKDYRGRTGSGYQGIDFCAVGEGIVDTRAVVKKAKTMDVTWAVVEQDLHKLPPLEDARRSIDNLKALFAD